MKIIIITNEEGFRKLGDNWEYFNKIEDKDYEKYTKAIEEIQEEHARLALS